MSKGQYFTLEQMLLFTIGIVITIAIYFSLVAANEGIRSVAEEDQLNEMGRLVISGMNVAYLSPDEITLVMEIPKKISGKSYNILVEDDGVNYNLVVRVPDRIARIPLERKYQASGLLTGNSGIIVIEKSGGLITIG